jgi:pimeloyl-ACP methyl ester carboxylesterase
MADSGDHRRVVLFGERIAYRQVADRGPVVVLLHGLADIGHSGQSATHLPTDGRGGAMTVIVPDLLGHGLSAKPRTDYSRGAHANVLRDLLDGLGHARVTLVGHSLGGVALQFAYQCRRRCEALMLVASGGLGGDVAGLLRAAALRARNWPCDCSPGSVTSGGPSVRSLARCTRSAMSTTFSGCTAHWPPPKPGRRYWPRCARSSPPPGNEYQR